MACSQETWITSWTDSALTGDFFFIHKFNVSDCSSLLRDFPVSPGQRPLKHSPSVSRMISDAWADVNQQGSQPSQPYKSASEARWQCYSQAHWAAKSFHHPTQKLNFDGKSWNFSYEPLKGNPKFHHQMRPKAPRLPVADQTGQHQNYKLSILPTYCCYNGRDCTQSSLNINSTINYWKPKAEIIFNTKLCIQVFAR